MKVNFTPVVKAVKHAARSTVRFVKKHRKAIAAVVSTGLTVGGTVVACKNTIKYAPRFQELKEEREKATDKKDIRKNTIETVKTAAKAYVVPAAMIAGGQVPHLLVETSMESEIVCLNAALGTTVAQVKQLKKANPEEELDETPEDESEKYSPKADIPGLSPYAVLFDEHHPWWKMFTPEMRYRQICAVNREVNDLLPLHGPMCSAKYPKPLFMNDIYERLEFPDTTLGTHSGYWHDVESPTADNRVDFIFYDAITGKRITRMEKEEINTPIWIDFNVDYGYVTKFLEVN